jgi:hypothetical protein
MRSDCVEARRLLASFLRWSKSEEVLAVWSPANDEDKAFARAAATDADGRFLAGVYSVALMERCVKSVDGKPFSAELLDQMPARSTTSSKN